MSFASAAFGACFGLILTSGAVFAADPALLSLSPSNASVIGGLQVEQSKKSPLGQYVLGRMHPGDGDLAKLAAETGFDLRRDVSEIVFSLVPSNAANTPSAQMIAARGTFHPAQMGAAILAHGGAVASLRGVSVYTSGEQERWALAFLDENTAVLGDPDSVRAAIAQHAAGTPAGAWAAQAQTLSANNDFWFLTNGPLSALTSAVPQSQLGGAMQGGQMFQAVTQASGGLRFGENLVFTGEAVTRSDKDAQALADLLRFLAAMLQNNKQADPAVQNMASILGSLILSTDANVMHVSLTVPEEKVEALLRRPVKSAATN